ncbi:MAG: hypothetical protein RMK79_05505 [Anaerolineae bacterium]|nr:hypothetical protein [Anaerolineae bacterium]
MAEYRHMVLGEHADQMRFDDYLDKYEARNRTARALTEHGLAFIAARHLHERPI